MFKNLSHLPRPFKKLQLIVMKVSVGGRFLVGEQVVAKQSSVATGHGGCLRSPTLKQEFDVLSCSQIQTRVIGDQNRPISRWSNDEAS